MPPSTELTPVQAGVLTSLTTGQHSCFPMNTKAVLRKRKTAFLIPTESEAEPPVTAEFDTYQYLVNSRLPSL